MARFDEHEEQAQQHWYARVARQRQDLSASVEETLLDTSLQEDQEGDEIDHPGLAAKDSTLIPPRLSLQSKPLPTVHPDASPEPFIASTFNSTAFSSAPQAIVGKTQSLPKIEGVLPASPAEYTLSPMYTASSQLKAVKSAFSKASETTPDLPKLATKRTTKVRLQVVPRTEKTHCAEEMDIHVHEAATNPELPAAQKQTQQPTPPVAEPQRDVTGSGTFERGQCDLAVANEGITASSVVVVVLTADPGPVVVQYISLQPQVGFTIHLSAAARNATSFNFTIL